MNVTARVASVAPLEPIVSVVPPVEPSVATGNVYPGFENVAVSDPFHSPLAGLGGVKLPLIDLRREETL